MKAIRKIIEHHSGSVTIELPKEYNDKKVEVIVLPLAQNKNIKPKPKYDLNKFFGKLQWKGNALAEQRKLRNEWD